MVFNPLNMPLCTLGLMNPILLVWLVRHLVSFQPALRRSGLAFTYMIISNFILVLLLCHSGSDCLGWDLVSCLLDSQQALLLNYDKYLWRGLLGLLCLCPSPSPFLVSLAQGATVATYKRKWTWKCYANQIMIVAFGHHSVVSGWLYYVF